MGRMVLNLLELRLEAAYRTGGVHALLANLASVRPLEWDVRPLNPSSNEFGNDPELSIRDIVVHVGGCKYMYADHGFNGDSLKWGIIDGWGNIYPPSDEMEAVLAWLEEGHRVFMEAVATLRDDAELAVDRMAPWRRPLRTEQII